MRIQFDLTHVRVSASALAAFVCLSLIGPSVLAANIGFFPDPIDKGAALALAEFFEENGHTIDVVDAADIADDIDLIIHTDTQPTPPSAFATIDKPVIAWDADLHDNSLIARLGRPVTFEDGFDLTVVDEKADHPVLGGMTGDIPWTNIGWTLQGIGGPAPGGQVLLTYPDPQNEDIIRPGLIVLEKGAAQLGFFGPQPIEGAGYWVGGDLDATFAPGPRSIQLAPVNTAAHSNVKLTMALAATDADFEVTDNLLILVDVGNGFEPLAVFTGVEDEFDPCFKGLADEAGHCLSPIEFRDFTWDVPDGADELTLLIGATNTFPNEVLGIDNIRITGDNDELIHHQGFNDPEPAGYEAKGRGFAVADVGPGMWDVSLNVDEIGFPAFAPARRAAILWADGTTDPDTGDEDIDWWEEESLEIWLNLVNWALASTPNDLNGDGVVDAADIDEMSQRVLDGVATKEERQTLIESPSPEGFNTYIGDSNLDGVFDDQDFVSAFIAGQYLSGNRAGWAEGDWDGNLIFDEQDIVNAFIQGDYLKPARTAAVAGVPEPSTCTLAIMCLLGLAVWHRGR